MERLKIKKNGLNAKLSVPAGEQFRTGQLKPGQLKPVKSAIKTGETGKTGGKSVSEREQTQMTNKLRNRPRNNTDARVGDIKNITRKQEVKIGRGGIKTSTKINRDSRSLSRSRNEDDDDDDDDDDDVSVKSVLADRYKKGGDKRSEKLDAKREESQYKSFFADDVEDSDDEAASTSSALNRVEGFSSRQAMAEYAKNGKSLFRIKNNSQLDALELGPETVHFRGRGRARDPRYSSSRDSGLGQVGVGRGLTKPHEVSRPVSRRRKRG